ncbi:S-layer homology domain-containing protein [Bacillus pseudomycoides]|uniref:S-layer homology domain-containing protein n=1 Tax=Bacillus bingmayongensis TaxID=1150157 RepID=A0ABU5JRP9_9BACI|nr:S-layer homology domain-containing protein [Bacillus pseudomycoides]
MAKNKSFNKLMAGTMTAAMVAGVVAPVATSAEENAFKDVPSEHWSAKAINDMTAKGIIVGNGDGTFGFGKDVTRAQIATFIVKAQGLQHEKATPSFSDVPASNIYANFIGIAEKHNIMAGLGDGKFGPDQKLTRAQMAQLIVNAYGFTADENNKKTFDDIDNLPWETAKSSIETLASLGIVAGQGEGKFDPNGVVTREQAAQFIYNAMNYEPGSTGEAKVQSVEAINASEIKVSFNHPVDRKTATDLTKYTFKHNENDVALEDFEGNGVLTKDGKGVIFRLKEDKALSNGDKYAVHVSTGVLGADLKPIPKYLDTVKTFSDSVKPELLGARVVDGDKVQLTFNKPVKNNSKVKIDGLLVEPKDLVASKTPGVYTLTTNKLTNPEGIFDRGEHAVVAYDVEDTLPANPNRASILETKYVVSADTTEPEVKAVKQINSHTFKVTFSETLGQDPEITVKKGNYTFPNAGERNVTGAPGHVQFTIDPTDSKSYIVSIAEDENGARNPLYAAGEKSVALSVNLKNFKDNVHLLGKPVDKSVTLSQDTATPKVVSDNLNTIEGNTLKIKFNGGIEKADASKVVVRANNGVVITPTEVKAEGNFLNITLPSPAVAGPYDVQLKDGAVKFAKVLDLAYYSVNTNANTEFTTKVGNIDVSTPVVKKDSSIISAEGDVVTINYGEDMSSNAKLLENYTIDGKALPEGTTADFYGNKQVVKVKLPADFLKKNQDVKFTISTNVLTASGSKVVANEQTLAPVENIIRFIDNEGPQLDSAVYLKADKNDEYTNTIKLTFNENLGDITKDGKEFIDDLKVVVNNNASTVTGIEKDAKEANVVYLTLDPNEKPINLLQAATISVVPPSKTNAQINIVDVAGNKLSLGSVVASTSEVSTKAAPVAAEKVAEAKATEAQK